MLETPVKVRQQCPMLRQATATATVTERELVRPHGERPEWLAGCVSARFGGFLPPQLPPRERDHDCIDTALRTVFFTFKGTRKFGEHGPLSLHIRAGGSCFRPRRSSIVSRMRNCHGKRKSS
ncbi:hypothetical protein H0G86_008585 [Trichoderma simmonsii]|uniref:Uncharacterized protein n=1 Tax=Trichoderma simmonsii TaxID=1491479 RepID=A0A8G0LHR7_9HYPO|nr:hypothetical protein H0G86_008585 [Trichoderma simmonsii]